MRLRHRSEVLAFNDTVYMHEPLPGCRRSLATVSKSFASFTFDLFPRKLPLMRRLMLLYFPSHKVSHSMHRPNYSQHQFSASCRYIKLCDALGIPGLLQELLSKTAENFQASETRRLEAEATCLQARACRLHVGSDNPRAGSLNFGLLACFRPEPSGKHGGCGLIV